MSQFIKHDDKCDLIYSLLDLLRLALNMILRDSMAGCN